MRNQYLRLGENDKVIGMFWYPETEPQAADEVPEGGGAPVAQVEPEDSYADPGHGCPNCVRNPTPFENGWPQGDTPTQELYWTGAGTAWVETSTFAQRRQKAVDKCLDDVDLVTKAAVGARSKEYLKAEVAARAFKAANYEGAVHSYVSSYAQYNPTLVAQTNKWAADTIIARADAFEAAEEALRLVRFRLQHGMYSSKNDTELSVPVGEWNAFIQGLRAQLGI